MERISKWARRQRKYAFAAFQSLTGIDATNAFPALTQAFQSDNLVEFIQILFKTAIIVGSIIAVLRLAYAGFLYMMSDVFSQKEHAKQIIQQSLTGILILLGIWLILRQINPDILQLNVLRSVSVAPSSTLASTDHMGLRLIP